MRILNHPVLGEAAPKQNIVFYFNGEPMTGFKGEPIAAALKANNISVHRYTRKAHSPRGVFCAIGRCTDCVMVVDGKPNVRTCVTPLQDGMKVETQHGAGGGA